MLQDETGELLAGAPGWLGDALLWLAVAGVFLLAVAAAGVWALVARTRALAGEAGRLDALEAIRSRLDQLLAERSDLDLRRLEHVLLDVRDAQLRLEDALLRSIEAGRAGREDAASGVLVPVPRGDPSEAIGERVTNRLLALGYQQVQIVTRAEKLAELAAQDGDVLIEARRDGVLHKGRVGVRSGRLANVEIHPAYSIFP